MSLTKESYIEGFALLKVNDVTLEALNKMTLDELRSLWESETFAEGPVTTETGPALHVIGEICKPPHFTESLTWIDADPDAETARKINEQREVLSQKLNLGPITNDAKFPGLHGTIKFGIDPSAIESIDQIWKFLEDVRPFGFTKVVPLGPKGKENAWGLFTPSEDVFNLMYLATIDQKLSRDQPKYVPVNGWSKLPQSEFGILPHLTWVRNLPSIDVNNPPVFEGLEELVCKYDHLRLRAGIVGEQSKIKIKLIKDFPRYVKPE
jgi:hypothetical protein